MERKHQHLLNVACVLYFQSKIPIHFWTHYILMATFFINRIPSPLLYDRTPYELLYNKVVDYSSFHVFGCLALSSTLTTHHTKFQPCDRKCVFLGYPTRIKGYRCMIFTLSKCSFPEMWSFMKQFFPFIHFLLQTI